MVVAGIIAEYNPLHNGHVYQIQKVKEKLNPDYIIVALGNNFTQRGGASILDKYNKTELAIELGVDLVLEIPQVFTVSSAENFAKAGVTILNNTKVVTHLCFGCENDNVDKMYEVAKLLVDEPNKYKQILKEELNKGVSFAVARSNAICEIFKNDNEIKELISMPNNILAIEYIKELIKLKSKIKPYTIKRSGPGFYDTDIINNISSATNLRTMLKDKKDIKNYVPECVEKLISKKYKGRQVLDINDYSDLLHYILKTKNINEIKNIYEIKEGLENTLNESCKTKKTISEIVDDAKSKRFTYTGISRAIVNIILGITKEDFKNSLKVMPKYIRVLGFKEGSSELLSKITKSSKCTIITNVNKYLKDKKSSKEICEELNKEIKYNNIYQIKLNADTNLDYTKNMIVK